MTLNVGHFNSIALIWVSHLSLENYISGSWQILNSRFKRCDKNDYSWILPDLTFVFPESIQSHFWTYSDIGRTNDETHTWKVIWDAIMFCIWKKRDGVIFNMDSVDSFVVVQQIKFLIRSWFFGGPIVTIQN